MSNETLVAPGIVTNLDELILALRATGAPVDPIVHEGVVSIPLRAPPLTTTVFARWETSPPYMHIVAPIIDGIADDQIAAAEAAVVRLNNAHPYPGFTVDYAHHAIAFKVTYPTTEGISSSTLGQLLETLVGFARNAVVTLHKVVREGADPASVLELHDLWVDVDRVASSK